MSGVLWYSWGARTQKPQPARRVRWYACAALALLVAGCAHGSGSGPLLGTWINHRAAAKRPAILSIAFLPQQTVTVREVDTLAAAGWNPPTTWTGQYEILAPHLLKFATTLGSFVLTYRITGGRLTLSGESLAQMLGTTVPPQTLDKTAP